VVEGAQLKLVKRPLPPQPQNGVIQGANLAVDGADKMDVDEVANESSVKFSRLDTAEPSRLARSSKSRSASSSTITLIACG
jgi:hypothetical protein